VGTGIIASVARISEGLHRLGDWLVNFYLVEDQAGLSVVDAGLPKHYAVLEAGLREIGRSWEDFKALVLTHAHFDHVGFADKLRTERGVPVYVHTADEQLARTQKAKTEGSLLPYLRHRSTWKLLGNVVTAGLPRHVVIKELRTFGDGDELDVPGRPRVVHAPGHTDGSVALHFAGHNTLLVGDILCSWNPLTGGTGPQLMARAFASSSDQALASLSRIEGIEAPVMGFGHGDPWRDGVAAAVRHARAIGKT
jgi:glyoxylase-like metal-dependent hydrolase (beta-lactamase superfamily II)